MNQWCQRLLRDQVGWGPSCLLDLARKVIGDLDKSCVSGGVGMKPDQSGLKGE